MTPRAFTLADGFVVVALLALSWVPWGGSLPADGRAAAVEVISAAGTTREPLVPARELRVPGPLGESVLELGPEGVRFTASPCPLQLCVHSGRLARPGAVAACLPNRVAVRVLGSVGKEAVDAVGR